MNILPLFWLIRKFCADSQNQEPSVDWVIYWYGRILPGYDK